MVELGPNSELPGSIESCTTIAEGFNWRGHVFINLGDSNYSHDDDTRLQIKQKAKELDDSEDHFNGDLVAFTMIIELNNELLIDAQPTDFATHLVYSHKSHGIKADGKDLMPTAAGMAALLLTANNMVVLTQHGKKTYTPGQFISIPSGCIEPKHITNDGIIDPFLTFDQELEEELGIKPSEIVEEYCAGIVKNNSNNVHDVIIFARTRLTSEEITTRMGKQYSFHTK